MQRFEYRAPYVTDEAVVSLSRKRGVARAEAEKLGTRWREMGASGLTWYEVGEKPARAVDLRELLPPHRREALEQEDAYTRLRKLLQYASGLQPTTAATRPRQSQADWYRTIEGPGGKELLCLSRDERRSFGLEAPLPACYITVDDERDVDERPSYFVPMVEPQGEELECPALAKALETALVSATPDEPRRTVVLTHDAWAACEYALSSDGGKQLRCDHYIKVGERIWQPDLVPNPRGRTGLQGRGKLTQWGANKCIDYIITRREGVCIPKDKNFVHFQREISVPQPLDSPGAGKSRLGNGGLPFIMPFRGSSKPKPNGAPGATAPTQPFAPRVAPLTPETLQQHSETSAGAAAPFLSMSAELTAADRAASGFTTADTIEPDPDDRADTVVSRPDTEGTIDQTEGNEPKRIDRQLQSRSSPASPPPSPPSPHSIPLHLLRTQSSVENVLGLVEVLPGIAVDARGKEDARWWKIPTSDHVHGRNRIFWGSIHFKLEGVPSAPGQQSASVPGASRMDETEYEVQPRRSSQQLLSAENGLFFFDVESSHEAAIRITRLTGKTFHFAGLKVYYCKGTFAGRETDPDQWTLVSPRQGMNKHGGELAHGGILIGGSSTVGIMIAQPEKPWCRGVMQLTEADQFAEGLMFKRAGERPPAAGTDIPTSSQSSTLHGLLRGSLSSKSQSMVVLPPELAESVRRELSWTSTEMPFDAYVTVPADDGGKEAVFRNVPMQPKIEFLAERRWNFRERSRVKSTRRASSSFSASLLRRASSLNVILTLSPLALCCLHQSVGFREARP